ncbi:MAG: hypothetical protein AAFX02_05735 [Pseudomonadota bacterium]
MSLITVFERIPLKPKYATPEGAVQAGQAYDDIAGDNAHDAPGHAGHASFFFDAAKASLVVFYPWLGRANLEQLLASEDAVLADWFAEFAAGPRETMILDELAVVTDEAH